MKFLTLLISCSLSLLCTALYGHIYDEYIMNPINTETGLKRFPTYIKISNTHTLMYSFVIPEGELLNNLNIDKDGNNSIDDKEFNEGHTDIDKWVRQHISLSVVSGSSFFKQLFNIREICLLKKAEYAYADTYQGEKIYRTRLQFSCSSSQDYRVLNKLIKLYRREIAIVFTNIYLTTQIDIPLQLKGIPLIEELTLSNYIPEEHQN